MFILMLDVMRQFFLVLPEASGCDHRIHLLHFFKQIELVLSRLPPAPWPNSLLITPHLKWLDPNIYVDLHQIAHTPKPSSTKFHGNPCCCFCVIFLTTNQQTNKQMDRGENITSSMEIVKWWSLNQNESAQLYEVCLRVVAAPFLDLTY